jgi:hypothetical protein
LRGDFVILNDPTNKQGLIQDIDFTTGADSIAYPLADKVRNINRALDRVAYLIQIADKKWQWEDTNNSDLPVASTNLVAGQRVYELDTTFLEILKVAIKDESGNYHIVPQVDIYDADYRAKMILEDNPIQGQSQPTVYDLHGVNILVDPIPNYSSDAGIKVWLKRNAQYFTTSDTTKEAGFNPQFHKYLSLYASYEYLSSAKGNNLQLANQIRSEMINMENAISQHYSMRNKDKPLVLAFRKTQSE